MNRDINSSSANGLRSFGGLDLLLVLINFVLWNKLYLGSLEFSSARLVVLASALVVTYVVFFATGVYRVSSTALAPQILGRLTIAWGIVVSLVVFIVFLTQDAIDVSRVWFSLSVIFTYLTLVATRACQIYLIASSIRRGERIKKVVVVGVKESMRNTINRVASNPDTGYEIVGVFAESEDVENWEEDSALFVGYISELLNHIEQARLSGQPISQVWITLPLSEEVRIRQISEELRASSVDICLIPDTFGMQVLTGSHTNVAELTVINFTDIRLRGSAERFKRFADQVMASMALILLWPLLIAIAIAIKIDSQGPILFTQRRYGMNGREFVVWKFRSMKVQEDDESVRQATRYDDRVTKVGAFLRRHSLDELPQFFNVLQGSMSLVGPRPHAVSHNEEYRHKIDGYMMRHKIKPGITGWAQINGWRGETDTLEKMEQRVLFDLEYIRNWSVWLDAKILLLTVFRAFSGKDVY